MKHHKFKDPGPVFSAQRSWFVTDQRRQNYLKGLGIRREFLLRVCHMTEEWSHHQFCFFFRDLHLHRLAFRTSLIHCAIYSVYTI